VERAISVFGLGYVGSVTAACFAHLGHTVIGVDALPLKVEAIASGKAPIVEARVPELIAEAHSAGRLSATTNVNDAVARSSISFISVGTPNQRNGKLDLAAIERVCEQIGQALRHKDSFHWIVLRSTVLPGTCESVVIPSLEKASGKKAGTDFGVCFNPEFLREGSAVSDFFEPPFTVIGSTLGTPLRDIRALYTWAPSEIFETTATTAEMVKYVCNAFHALKVAFANEIGTICDEVAVDKQMVMDIFKADTRLNISRAYLTPGAAFGGSCLPKDLRALNYRAKELDLKLPVLQSILPSNSEHMERAIERVLATGKRKVAVLGLSFKSGTDDLRESPMVHIAKRLLGEGREMQIWDDAVSLGQLIGSNRQFIQETIPQIGSLLVHDWKETVRRSEVVLLGTNSLSREQIIEMMTGDQLLIDLVRLEQFPGRQPIAMQRGA